jgi:hypothetical protein
MIGRLLSFIQTAVAAASQTYTTANSPRASGGEISRIMDEKLMYVEVLHLHPIIVHVTFTPTGELAEKYSRFVFTSFIKMLIPIRAFWKYRIPPDEVENLVCTCVQDFSNNARNIYCPLLV